MTTIITYGNFKGGVGKTTASCMTSILLARGGYRTLHVDFDPQADSTEFLVNVHDCKLKEDYTSLYESLLSTHEGGSTDYSAIISIADNLDLLPSGADLIGYDKLALAVADGEEEASHFLLDAYLEEIKEEYDYIIIDVPPTLNIYNSSALLASTETVVVMKTQRKSLNATRKYLGFVDDVNQIKEEFGYEPLRVTGILPYLIKKSSPLDNEIVSEAKREFGPLVFDSHILERERIKRYDEEGISFNQMDMHDKDVFKMYQDITDELLKRIGGDQHD